MVDMKAFNSLAKKYNLALIEDAAHAIESERDGIKPGELSDAACFSFYATKGMTCGEGGAIACNSSEDAGWYRSARHHGISKNASYRYTKGYQHWDMNMMGWKYNMDDIQAALLINQIDRLDDNRQRRQELEYLYRKNLSDIPYLDFIEAPFKDEQSGHHLFTILLPDHVGRDYIINELQSKGIGCAVNYISVHNLTYFKETHGYLEEEDVVYICDILRNLIG
jgi:dTDP-4-amino-4,6-dideoxygalactose transaminase